MQAPTPEAWRRAVAEIDRPGRTIWLLVVLTAVAEFGLAPRVGSWGYALLEAVHLLFVGLLGFTVVNAGIRGDGTFLRDRSVDLILFAASLVAASFDDVRAAGLIAILRFFFAGMVRFTEHARGARLLHWLLARPAMALVMSFSVTILAGTVLLMSPAALTSGEVDSPLTALFIATSATCVTGLSNVDVVSHYTRFGQWVILVLIQVGGLGIITITSALAVMLQRGLSPRLHGAVQEIMEADTVTEMRVLLVGVVGMSGAVEMAGAALLHSSLERDHLGNVLEGADRVFYAVFHAISAYCNAGFALYPDSLARFVGSVPVNAVVCALVVIGGLGANALVELARGRWILHGPRLAWDFLSLHTKMTLTATAALIISGALFVLLLERGHSLRTLGVVDSALAAIFQSVATRTAGFSTVDFAAMSPPGALLCMFYMFIGGSPGGTAGGIKTTTAALFFLAVRAMMRGRPRLDVFGRTIPDGQMYRAITVVALSSVILGVLSLSLLIAEPEMPFLALMFEAVSAFSTTGLSLGITAQLSGPGQLIVVALMFAGRIGPFTLAIAVGSRPQTADIGYPAGRVLVG